MSRVFIHVHVFYPQMWAELKACVQNVTEPYDLFVTVVEDYPDLTADILTFCPAATIERIPNKGYDVGPFIHAIGQINLDDYDYVVKLHTKRDMPIGSRLGGFNVSGPRWREWALSFVSSTQNFNACLERFTQDATLGMCAHYRLIVQKHSGDAQAIRLCKDLMLKSGLPVVDFRFVAGTMFMIRAKLLSPVKTLGLQFDDFSVPTPEKPTSLAHTMERFFGAIVLAQGYTIEDPYNCIKNIQFDRRTQLLRTIWNFTYRVKQTRNKKFIVKIFKIPVFYGNNRR